MNSILNSIKKMLGIEADYHHFDSDIITHINSTFNTLNQLGVGPEEGYQITSDIESWEDFLGEFIRNLAMIKSYVYLKVRMLFDPPSSSIVANAFNENIKEYESRINIQVELMKKEE